MHVLHLCDSSVEGDYFESVASGLSRNGVHVTLAQLGSGKPPSWIDRLPGVQYVSFNADKKRSYPTAMRRIAAEARARGIDLIHTHLFYSGLVSVAASRLFTLPPVALMRHHTGIVHLLGSRFHVRADRWMAENARYVMTVSNAAKEYMVQIDGIRRNDIETVYLGFDFQKYRPDETARSRVREELNLSDSDIVIGYVANLLPGKGHDQLISAFSELARTNGNVKLLLVGRGELSEVSAASRKLSGNVIVTGWRRDIPACLNAMDIFVQPSLSEAFSQVIVEAMGVGLPVVATDVGGAREVIDDGRTGFVVPPADTAAIVQRLEPLIRDANLRSQIGRAGRGHVVANFTSEKMVSRHLELYSRWTGKD